MATLASVALSSSIFQNIPYVAPEAFVYAFLGGLLPALVWLWFWMHEGHDHHESKSTIWYTFIAGMVAVILVLPFQQFAQFFIGKSENDIWTITIWAGLEELFKFGAAYLIALRSRKIFDEPIDAFVYLMTAALGFAAMENMIFLITPLIQGQTLISIMTGNMRFMGANLLHVASSGVLSIFIGLTYYKKKWLQRTSVVFGLIVATLLHALFNFLIILVTEVQEQRIFIAFSFVWFAIVLLILALERVKTIKDF